VITREMIDEAAVAAVLVFKDSGLSFERLQEIAEAIHAVLVREARMDELND
jgi:chromosome segregation and condensation protein ScpB